MATSICKHEPSWSIFIQFWSDEDEDDGEDVKDGDGDEWMQHLPTKHISISPIHINVHEPYIFEDNEPRCWWNVPINGSTRHSMRTNWNFG